MQIELKLGTGSVKVLLPDEATADVDALVATMGAVKSNVASKPKLKPKPKAGATHFVVCGHTRGWDRSACGGAASSPGCVSKRCTSYEAQQAYARTAGRTHGEELSPVVRSRPGQLGALVVLAAISDQSSAPLLLPRGGSVVLDHDV